MNAYDFLVSADASDESVAIIDPAGRYWLYQDVRILVEHLSGFIEESSYVQDRCLIYAGNSMFWVCCYLAALRTGRIAVPVPVDLPPSHLERIIQSSSPRLAFVDGAHLEALLKHKTDRLVAVCEQATDGAPAVDWAEALAFLPTEHPRNTAENTIATLMYPLSPRGDARAIIHTHRNIVSSTQSLADAMSASPADRVMCFLPLSHPLGLALLHTHLHVGACVALEKQPLDAIRMLSRLHEYACTGLWATGHELQLMLAHAPVQETPLPNLRYIQQVGARLPAAAMADLHHALPGKQVYCIYSEPEASGAITLLPPALADAKPDSVGKPLPGVHVELLTPTGKPAQPGEVGQIVVGGPAVARGYWPESGQGEEASGEGRLYTGDLAALDNDGYLQIAGRAADQMKLGGAAVSATHIEEVVSTFPGMTEVAVFARPDDTLGDIVVLAAVHPRGEEVRQQLMDFCASKLPFNQRPREIRFRSQLPRDGSGALDRAALQEEAEGERPLPQFVDNIQASQEPLQA